VSKKRCLSEKQPCRKSERKFVLFSLKFITKNIADYRSKIRFNSERKHSAVGVVTVVVIAVLLSFRLLHCLLGDIDVREFFPDV
jgi:hypothetical protein